MQLGLAFHEMSLPSCEMNRKTVVCLLFTRARAKLCPIREPLVTMDTRQPDNGHAVRLQRNLRV